MLEYFLLLVYLAVVGGLCIWIDFGKSLGNIHYWNSRLIDLDWKRNNSTLLWKGDVYHQDTAIFLLECSLLSSLILTKSAITKKVLPDEFHKIFIIKGTNYFKLPVEVGFIGISKKGIVIVIKSTATLSDVMISIDNNLINIGSGSVHRGYWFHAIECLPSILSLLQKYSYIKRIFITGHSFGGAIGSILYYQLSKFYGSTKKFSCYTYGSPKFCTNTFLEDTSCTTVYHHLNKKDPVIGKPNKIGYSRFGNEVYHSLDTGNDNVNHSIKIYLECVRREKVLKYKKRTPRWDEMFSRWALDMLG